MSDFEKYEASVVTPFAFDDPERHDTAVREVSEMVTFTSDKGQNFSGIFVNRDFIESGEALVVRPNSMFGDTKGADQKYIAYQEAAASPNRSFIIIDQPAHGASDLLTDEQARAIKDSGDLSLIGKAHVEAIINHVDVKEVIVTGEALGARMSSEFAAEAPEYDLDVKYLFGFDMPGLENRWSVGGVGLGFLARVPKSRALYEKGDANQKLKKSFEDFQTDLSKYGQVHLPSARSEASVWKRQKSLATFLLRNSPLANDSAYDTILKAFESNDEMMVNLVFCGLSAVGRLNDEVKSKLTRLSELSGGSIAWSLWPDDDQGIGYAPHRPRLIAFMLDKQKNKF